MKVEAIIDNEVLCDVITEIKIFVETHIEIGKNINLNLVELNRKARIIQIWMIDFRWYEMFSKSLYRYSNNEDYFTIVTMLCLYNLYTLDNQEWGLIWYLICLLPVICLLRVLSIHSMEDMFFGTCRVVLVVSNILSLDVR